MTIDGKAYAAWMKSGFDFWMLGAEAGTVMMLRTARIAAGGSTGAAEAELMVTEEIRAALELQTRLITGALDISALGTTQGTLKHSRDKVTANNKRLSRPVGDRRI